MLSTPFSFIIITSIISQMLWQSVTAQADFSAYPSCAISCLNDYAQTVCAGDNESNSCLCGTPDFANGVAQCASEDCGLTDGGQTIVNIWGTMNSLCNESGTSMTVTLQDFESGAGVDPANVVEPTSGGSDSGGYVGSSGGGAVPADIPADTPADSGPVQSGAIDPIQFGDDSD
jgi:hypothetical protein